MFEEGTPVYMICGRFEGVITTDCGLSKETVRL